jgi:hypothetical protein
MHDMTFEQRLARVDLKAIMTYVQREHGMSDETTARAEDLYRKFLTLHHKYPGIDFTPSRLIDHVWHAHILWTEQYKNDCDLLFGEFMNHNPIRHLPERLEKSRENTQVYFEKTFGIPLNHGLIPEYACMSGCSC